MADGGRLFSRHINQITLIKSSFESNASTKNSVESHGAPDNCHISITKSTTWEI